MVKPWLYTQIFVTMSTVFIGMVCDIIVHEKSAEDVCFDMDLILGSHIVYSVWELYTWFVTKKALLEIMTPPALAMMPNAPNEDQNKTEEIESEQQDVEKVEDGEKVV